MAKRIEMWPLDRLVPYDRNSRLHSPEQIAQVAASIAEFGFVNPILVDSNAGIIAGHGRLAAAKALGLTDLPVVVLDHLSERQRRAYVIADNKLALNASWDDSVLAAELGDLAEMDFDLSLIGFSDEELADLLPDAEFESGSGLDEPGEEESPTDESRIVIRVDSMFRGELMSVIKSYCDEHAISISVDA
jgi:ParB-like chromosome segregation protein Spo0J